MADYEKLIDRLYDLSRFLTGQEQNDVREAADSIEELSKLNAEITRRELKLRMEKPRWIPVTEDTPSDFVSVQAHMTDAGNFPSVREAYTIDKLWFFPALKEFHPVDKWRRFDEPPKEE